MHVLFVLCCYHTILIMLACYNALYVYVNTMHVYFNLLVMYMNYLLSLGLYYNSNSTTIVCKCNRIYITFL